MKYIRLCIFAMAVCALAACSAQGSLPYGASALATRVSAANRIVLQTLDVPLSQFPDARDTLLTGIRGNLITGFYTQAGGRTTAVAYNRTNGLWTALRVPLAASTAAYGPDIVLSSYRVVGSYVNHNSSQNHGFVYDGTSNTYTTLDAPTHFCGTQPCNETILHSIYNTPARKGPTGSNYEIVGNCDAVSSPTEDWTVYPKAGHALLYDSMTDAFKKIDVRKALSTTAYGIWIDGNVVAVAGGYTNAKGIHAYVRNVAGPQQLTYDYPGSTLTHFEGITGAGGAGNYNVIGDYTTTTQAEYGFFLQIRKWKAKTPVVIGKVSANSVYQNDVIGVYTGGGHVNGYITSIPK